MTVLPAPAPEEATDRPIAEPTRSKAPLYAWYVTFLLAFTHLVSLVDRHLLGVALVDVKAELQLSDTQLGLLYGTGFAVLYSVVSLPLGQLADRVNRKNLIAAGLALWTVATIATALTTSFNSFFALRMLVGIGEACLVPAGMSILMTLMPAGQLARATAVFATGGGQGRTVALLAGGPMLTAFAAAGGVVLLGYHMTPWRALFALASLPGLVLVPLLLMLREPPRQSAAQRQRLGEVLRVIAKRGRAYFFHFSSFTAVATIIWALSAWSLSVFVRDYAMTTAQAGLTLGTVALVTGPTGNLLGGWVLDRLSARGVLGASPLVIGVVLLLSIPPTLVFGLAGNLWWSVAGYTVLQFVMAFANAPGWLGTQILTSPENRGVAMALFVAMYTIVSLGIGPVIVGLLSDHVFTGPDGLGGALLTTLVAVMIIGGAMALIGRSAFIKVMRGGV